MGDAGAAAAACEEGLDSELVGVDDEDGEREEACAEEDEEERPERGDPAPVRPSCLNKEEDDDMAVAVSSCWND
jgi:hypothetical protein